MTAVDTVVQIESADDIVAARQAGRELATPRRRAVAHIPQHRTSAEPCIDRRHNNTGIL